MHFDLLMVYAYADKAHAKDRELWRGFFGFLLPMLLEIEATEGERLLEESTVRTPEELLNNESELESCPDLVRHMSASIAKSLMIPVELALAAFLDASLPTKIHMVGTQIIKRKSDEKIISNWLSKFSRIQNDPEFVEQVSQWKKSFDEFVETEDDEFSIAQSA